MTIFSIFLFLLGKKINEDWSSFFHFFPRYIPFHYYNRGEIIIKIMYITREKNYRSLFLYRIMAMYFIRQGRGCIKRNPWTEKICLPPSTYFFAVSKWGREEKKNMKSIFPIFFSFHFYKHFPFSIEEKKCGKCVVWEHLIFIFGRFLIRVWSESLYEYCYNDCEAIWRPKTI